MYASETDAECGVSMNVGEASTRRQLVQTHNETQVEKYTFKAE